MDSQKSNRLEYLANLWLSLTWVTLLISFFLAIFKGPLVMTWVFINSLQLIAHLPLVADRLPANVNFVLIKFLSLVRLNISEFNSTVDDFDLIQFEN